MIVIVSGRQSGKTHATISWLMEDPESRCILVVSEGRKRQVASQIREYTLQHYHRDMGYEYWADKIIVASRMESLRGRHYALGIDNLEEVLQAMFLGRVEFATANGALLPMEFEARSPMQVDVDKGRIEYRPPRMT